MTTFHLKKRYLIVFGVICLLVFFFGGVILYAQNSQSSSKKTTEILPDGTTVTKTVVTTTKRVTIDQIKDTLVATSAVNEKMLFDTIQTYRKDSKKKVTLKYSSKLADLAREYAKYLSDNNYFSHIDKKGVNGEVRLKNAGFPLSFWGELLSEAIDAPQAFSALKASKAHNEIMLKDDYTIVGVGYYKGKRVVLMYYDKKGQFVDAVQPATIKKAKKTSKKTPK